MNLFFNVKRYRFVEGYFSNLILPKEDNKELYETELMFLIFQLSVWATKLKKLPSDLKFDCILQKTDINFKDIQSYFLEINKYYDFPHYNLLLQKISNEKAISLLNFVKESLADNDLEKDFSRFLNSFNNSGVHVNLDGFLVKRSIIDEISLDLNDSSNVLYINPNNPIEPIPQSRDINLLGTLEEYVSFKEKIDVVLDNSINKDFKTYFDRFYKLTNFILSSEIKLIDKKGIKKSNYDLIIIDLVKFNDLEFIKNQVNEILSFNTKVLLIFDDVFLLDDLSVYYEIKIDLLRKFNINKVISSIPCDLKYDKQKSSIIIIEPKNDNEDINFYDYNSFSNAGEVVNENLPFYYFPKIFKENINLSKIHNKATLKHIVANNYNLSFELYLSNSNYRISDLFELIRVPNIKNKDYFSSILENKDISENSYQILNLSEEDTTKYILPKERETGSFYAEKKINERIKIKPYDIIISIRNSLGLVGIISPDFKNEKIFIPQSSCAILRFRGSSEISLNYSTMQHFLYLFLISEIAQDRIKLLSENHKKLKLFLKKDVKSIKKNNEIKLKDLGKMFIPDPKDMDKIFNELLDAYRKIENIKQFWK
jgi:hypothetical protein